MLEESSNRRKLWAPHVLQIERKNVREAVYRAVYRLRAVCTEYKYSRKQTEEPRAGLKGSAYRALGIFDPRESLTIRVQGRERAQKSWPLTRKFVTRQASAALFARTEAYTLVIILDAAPALRFDPVAPQPMYNNSTYMYDCTSTANRIMRAARALMPTKRVIVFAAKIALARIAALPRVHYTARKGSQRLVGLFGGQCFARSPALRQAHCSRRSCSLPSLFLPQPTDFSA